MDNICRFCLKVSIKNMCSLQECDILFNMQRFLTINIPTDDSFPNKLCKECFKEISKIIKYCIKLKENEDKLQKYSNNGSLKDYYSKIIGNNVEEIKSEQKVPKIETCFVTNDVTDDFANYEKLEKNIMSDATYFSSEEEKVLSSIKKEMNHNKTTNSVMEPETILTVKPIKYLRKDKKRNRKIDPDSIEYLKQFTCLMCLQPCDSHLALIDHYYDKHLSEGVASNSFKEFKSEGKTMYGCNSCEKVSKLKRQIVRHVMMTHSNDRLLGCKICARTYKGVPEIVRHARAHNGFKYQCKFNCGYTSAYQGAIKEHQNRHLDQYKYNCGVCGKGFNTKTWYEQHQNIHKGLKPFSCDICGMGFSMARYLQHHKYSTHPQTSDAKRYSCIHCDEKCESAKSLSVHMLVHGIQKDTHFLCDCCGKVLSSDYQLQYHHRMHAGIKPYSCLICKKQFAKNYNLRLHMSIHTGKNSHTCVRCGKVYSQRCTLLRHLKRYHPFSNKVEHQT